ncbi:MAG: SH3 domain-containing protein [Sulfuricella sp.]
MRVFLFFPILLWTGAALAQTAQVADVAGVNMRSGKAENYRIIRVLPPRAEVEVIEIDQGYAKVKAADGEAGWVLLKLLDISEAQEDKAVPPAKSPEVKQHQAELEAAQKELVEARVELANLQREIGQVNNQHPQNSKAPRFFLLLSALIVFAGGVVTGILILKAYYRKRLHGLRI